eukprot:CAMPEP_0194029294 /NCGR_PEP_ID=MMETSP0009_2-20130614/3059_1 /TAXON_ID=210454 /ORGANISM="Grammatophora oceanica, Strain CCMP 410" /LENGTH=80 /DNA_ID=CAMNT_0038668917 /DNA_START=86 /DNA_END=328 /DNA_ORIENTATION=-
MALRQIISKAVFPTLERDLHRSLGSELANAGDMVANFLSPQVYGYKSQTPAGGAFGATQKVQKVHYSVEQQGMFQDVEGH